MNNLLPVINKYIILLIIWSIIGIGWVYFIPLFVKLGLIPTDFRYDLIINNFMSVIEYLIKIIMVFLMARDFKKHQLNHLVLACIASFFYPILGLIILSILLIEKGVK